MFEINIYEAFYFDLGKNYKSLIIYGYCQGNASINDLLYLNENKDEKYKIIGFPMINRKQYIPSNIYIEIEQILKTDTPTGSKADIVDFLKNKKLVKN